LVAAHGPNGVAVAEPVLPERATVAARLVAGQHVGAGRAPSDTGRMEAEHEEVEDQEVECRDVDAGTGTQSIELDSDWVAYLAEADLPDTVSGVDYSISDFEGQESANV
jgi:hypothetical protein